jgi:thiol:disulfide interchange protein DsbC
MKSKVTKKSIVITFIICLLAGAASFAATKMISPEAELQKHFPKLRYKSIVKSDIDGFYEILTSDRIIYFHPESGYLFIGEIVNKEGRSLTMERYSEERYKLLTADDLNKAIKIGSGKNKVVEVTDPDCTFCRKMHVYWNMRQDVTRYVFFKPLDMHPEALSKSEYILTAKNREKALFEVYCGNLDGKKEILSKVNDEKGLLESHKAVAAKLQVSGTPAYWINGKFVSGANIPMIEKIIGKSGAAGTTAHSNSGANCGEAK